MKLKVMRYEKIDNYHLCQSIEDSNREVYRLDIFVDGPIKDETHESIVGKNIEIEWMHPYVQIAHNVQIIP